MRIFFIEFCEWDFQLRLGLVGTSFYNLYFIMLHFLINLKSCHATIYFLWQKSVRVALMETVCLIYITSKTFKALISSLKERTTP